MATLAKDALPPTASQFTDISHPDVWSQNRWQKPFEELRAAGGVHFFENSHHGPFWAITTSDPIVEVESKPNVFSSDSEYGGITVGGRGRAEWDADMVPMPMFIAMDAPQHTEKRKTVAPSLGPSPVAAMKAEAIARTQKVLDELPIGETFDWVDKVSIELTSQMLATLFDFPWEERRKLAYWSDVLADIEIFEKGEEARQFRLKTAYEMGSAFHQLWERKKTMPAANDLTSVMLRSDALGQMEDGEFMGQMILLIVGGNDTTRNTMSGFAYGLDQQPDAFAQLRDGGAEIVPNAVQEIIRWQTPLAHMRRTALADYELNGQTIRKGDAVAMFYASANREEAKFANADTLDLTRENARRHLSFGYGIHRCVGARVAELQLTVLLEEMQKRRLRVRVEQEPSFVPSCFVKGYKSMQVQLEKY